MDGIASPYLAPLPFPELAALYAPVADYDLGAMRRLADARRDDPAAFSAQYAKIVAIDPDSYISLGYYLVDDGRDDEAAAAYEQAIEKIRDPIYIANSVLWLVGYYCDHGRIQRAREVAQIAADVYSQRGLETMAYFLERTGKYAEAEEQYKKVIERYGADHRASLDDFYIRHEHRVSDGLFAAQAKAAMAKVFPSGLERVAISDLTSPPVRGEGTWIDGKHQKTLHFGMQAGDQVVAVNGYRLRNQRQWDLLWSLDDKPAGTTIVWRQGRYVEVKGLMKRMNYGPANRPA
jgi:tetratricopeptide (TPR) repeat protein